MVKAYGYLRLNAHAYRLSRHPFAAVLRHQATIRDAFARARAATPSILFMDEVLSCPKCDVIILYYSPILLALSRVLAATLGGKHVCTMRRLGPNLGERNCSSTERIQPYNYEL